MTSIERVEAAINLKEPDRVPVGPQVATFAARLAGLTNLEYIYELDRPEMAWRSMFNKFGGWDMVTPPVLQGYNIYWIVFPCWSPIWFNVRLPGRDYPADHQAFSEMPDPPMLPDPSGYDLILEEGFARFLSFRDVGAVRFFEPYILENKINSILDYWHEEQKKSLWNAGPCWLPFDVLAYFRNLKNFLIDIHKRPEKIREVCDVTIDGFIEIAKRIRLPDKYSNTILISGHRASGKYFSQKIFEELYFPYLKKVVENFKRSHILSSFHLDDDWTLRLNYFREFSKGSIGYVEFDGTTDIFKAKEILGDRMCIKGDVPPSLLALGTPREVEKYCRKLIDICGEGGGFVLGSGCETPPNTKPENFKTMIDTAKTYGVYRK